MLAAVTRCALALLALTRAAAAEPRKPPLPPGRDPGGIAIALISTGIDYTLPDVAARLARDGEGELIGWDAVDGDNRPMAPRGPVRWAPNWGEDGTLLARAIDAHGRRLIPVRISPAEPASLALAVAFLAETPARIVALPMWSATQAEWEPFRRAASRFSDLLFVVAAGDAGKDLDTDPVWPAAFALGNLLVVSLPRAAGAPGERAANAGHSVDAILAAPTADGAQAATPTTSLAAVRAADAVAGCWPELIAAHRGSALKAALLAAAAKAGTPADKPRIAPCTVGRP